MQSDYLLPTLAFVALAALSVANDWLRHRRRDENRALAPAGWIPWPLIMVLALIAAAFCAALWVKGG